MLIVGCDDHPGFQQIAWVDTETGEVDERRLSHREEAEQFYRTLQTGKVRVGMEASGHARWFERLLKDLQFELWIGDAAEIRTQRGNALLRFLLVEAAQVTVRSQPQWRSKFFHLAMRRGRKIAKVAMARKLAVHLYWMWRQGLDYGPFEKLGSHAGEPGNRHGVQ